MLEPRPSRRLRALAGAVVFALAGSPAHAFAQTAGTEKPFRAYEAVGYPWLRFGLEHRSRVEYLANDFRTAAEGDALALSLRTLFSTELQFENLVMGAELQDSRAYATNETLLNPTVINAFEPLQVYAALRFEDLVAKGDKASLTAGRFTIDFGSRRLLARNEFRNTINSFSGVDAQWTSPSGHLVRTFVVMPVVRLPSDAESLAKNDVEVDRENSDAILWGAFFGSAPLFEGIRFESYVLGLHESDGVYASANRQLFTPGARVFRLPAKGAFDFQLEGMFQIGSSRKSTAATDTVDLTHRAGSIHASGAYRFDVPWSPRVGAFYDYASGDRDPEDDINGRFDPLFGARRFDFGPTGFYGAVARSNVSSPGARIELFPIDRIELLAGYRAVWLASSRDAWTTAGLQDPTGASGQFVGQQMDARARWHIAPRNLVLEAGFVYFLRGRFATDAPEARPGDPVYAYTQVTGTL